MLFRSLNNASEHFIKLGNPAGEAAVLRLLTTLYIREQNPASAIRCLERTVSLDQHYRFPELAGDTGLLAELRQHISHP